MWGKYKTLNHDQQEALDKLFDRIGFLGFVDGPIIAAARMGNIEGVCRVLETYDPELAEQYRRR